MTKVIKITTEQYNRYIFEGIDYKKQGTQYDAAPIDFSINQDKTDKGNIGKIVLILVFLVINKIFYTEMAQQVKKQKRYINKIIVNVQQ